MDVTIIYHRSCYDGFVAALVLRKWLETQPVESAKYISAHYGDAAPDVTGRNVWIVDFSYPRDVLLTMNQQAKTLVVLDHHKTAEAALQEIDFCTFDLERSGARLAWDYINGKGSDVPGLVAYVEDRDLWRWALPGSREINAVINSYELDFESDFFADTFELSVPELYNRCYVEGAAILRYQDKMAKTIASNSFNVEFHGHVVRCVNTGQLISEVGSILCQDRPFSLTYFDTDIHRVFSLRSVEFDVSELAKLHGGGGHKNAAGFKLPQEAGFPFRLS